MKSAHLTSIVLILFFCLYQLCLPIVLCKNCHILNKLLPGDVVLADRGFDIADSVGCQQARLEIPAFTKGKKQLSALEIEHTRKIANVRIHVERVIGLVRRKYIILQSILPIETITAKTGDRLAPIDKIVSVCCALTNLSDSIIPFDWYQLLCRTKQAFVSTFFSNCQINFPENK